MIRFPIVKSLAMLCTFALIGCAPLPGPGGPQASEACSLERLPPLVGEPASVELAERAMRLSGARRLRWIRPGDAVTMDYIESRLNVRLDASNRVEAFDCG